MATKITQLIIDIGANGEDFVIGFKKDKEVVDGDSTTTVIDRGTISSTELTTELVDAINLIIDDMVLITGATVSRADVVAELKAQIDAAKQDQVQ